MPKRRDAKSARAAGIGAPMSEPISAGRISAVVVRRLSRVFRSRCRHDPTTCLRSLPLETGGGMNLRARFPAILVIAIVVAALDRLSKMWFLDHYQFGESRPV